MAAVRRKRGPKHPGVTILKPEPARRIGWRIRYTDPDTGKVKKPPIPPEHTSTLEQRERYAADKSHELTQRRADLVSGAVPATGEDLAKTVAHYLADHAHLDERTRQVNGGAGRKFVAYCARLKITKADDVTAPVLAKYRAHLVSEDKRTAKAGGKRGQFVSAGGKRSPRTINHDIGAIVTVLRYLRKLRMFARITYEDIEICLAKVKAPRKRPTFLKPAECQTLISAALAHDELTFGITREENRGLREKGTTHKYDPIAPFVLFVLMTGMRIGEALACDWSWIDLDATDEHGKPAGEIVIPEIVTKTGMYRTVVLEVSATLRALLLALAPDPKLRKGSVFDLSEGESRAALERLQDGITCTDGNVLSTGATWHELRRTCSTYLTNAPGIFGAASAHRAAAQLGHSVTVAQKDYTGLIRIPREARTLEAAMRIEAEAAKVVRRQQARTAASTKAKPARVAAAAALN